MFAKNKPSASIIIDDRRLKKTGLYPTRLRITYAREMRHYPTGIDITVEDFSQVQNPNSIGKEITPAQRKQFKEHKLQFDALLVKANEVLKSLKEFSFEGF